MYVSTTGFVEADTDIRVWLPEPDRATHVVLLGGGNGVQLQFRDPADFDRLRDALIAARPPAPAP